MSVIGFSTQGASNEPSPSIWADCPNTLLRDKGLGYFGHEDFLGNVTDTSLADGDPLGSGFLNLDADTGSAAPKAAEVGGYVTLTTGANDNDAMALYSPLLGPISKNSGAKLWAEIRLEPTTLFDGGFFFGIGEEAACVRDVVADNPSTSAVATLITESVCGFVSKEASSAMATVNLTYAKDAGTPVVIATDVLASTAIPTADRVALTAVTEVKLGLRFDGRESIYFYVNGVKVATLALDSTFDQAKNMAVIFGLKTGTANAKAFSLDWFRYAYQSRS